jgi:Tol biopolymer transport system component
VGTYQSPRVSPDGTTVVFETSDDAGENIALQDLVGKSASRRLTFGGHNHAPVWSPDNQWIAYESDRDGEPAVFRQRADGTGVAERLTKPDKRVRYTPQSWSRDGDALLLTADTGGVFELHVLSVKNKTTARYSDVRSLVPTEAAFSPDGHWIVYQKSDKDSANVRAIQSFVEPFPSTGAKYLVPLGTLGGHPYWSRQGDRLFFNTSATTSAVINVQTSPTVTFSPARPFSRAQRSEPNPATTRRNADALPDGRVLGVTLNLAREGDTGSQIVVVMNWQQWLNARVPRRP